MALTKIHIVSRSYIYDHIGFAFHARWFPFGDITKFFTDRRFIGNGIGASM